jgi:hypothetical protein
MLSPIAVAARSWSDGRFGVKGAHDAGRNLSIGFQQKTFRLARRQQP